MKKIQTFLNSKNLISTLLTSVLTLLVAFVFIQTSQSFLHGRLLVPALAPLLVPVLACFFAVPAIFLLNQASEKTFSAFEAHWINRYFQKYSTWLIIPFSVALVLGIFGRLLAAKWGVIDDHEIMAFLGRDGRLYPSEIFSALKLTEIGSFGLITRYRPAYYLLRLLECVVWGANPAYWYAFRLSLLILAVSLFWGFVAPRMGWLAGGVLSAYTLTFVYWADIVGRLGPGENYALLGLPVYIWGLVTAFQASCTKPKYILSGLAILLGSVICVGSKENFVLLVIPSAYLAFRAFKQRKYLLLFFSLGSIFFAIYVGIALAILISRSGSDVYANAATPLARVLSLLSALLTIRVLAPLAVLGCVLAALGGLLRIRSFSPNLRKTILQVLFWFVLLCIIYFSQLVFYNGVWPTDIRYDFPGMLYVPVAIYLLYLVAEQMFGEILAFKHPRFVVSFGWLSALALLVFSRGYVPTIESLQKNVQVTNAFTNRIEQASSLLKQDPQAALVLESGNVWDFEAVFSYESFLRAYGVDNPIFLRLHGYSPESVAAGLEQSLAVSLLNISSHGNELFKPLPELEKYQNRCISLNLSGSFETECQPIP